MMIDEILKDFTERLWRASRKTPARSVCDFATFFTVCNQVLTEAWKISPDLWGILIDKSYEFEKELEKQYETDLTVDSVRVSKRKGLQRAFNYGDLD